MAGPHPKYVTGNARARAQGVLPPRVFAWLWRAQVRSMLRRRERHVCKLQTVSAVMVRLAPFGPMLPFLGQAPSTSEAAVPSPTLSHSHNLRQNRSGVRRDMRAVKSKWCRGRGSSCVRGSRAEQQ